MSVVHPTEILNMYFPFQLKLTILKIYSYYIVPGENEWSFLTDKFSLFILYDSLKMVKIRVSQTSLKMQLSMKFPLQKYSLCHFVRD